MEFDNWDDSYNHLPRWLQVVQQSDMNTICYSSLCYWRCLKHLLWHLRMCLLVFQTMHWRLQMFQVNSSSWWSISEGKISWQFVDCNWSRRQPKHIFFKFYKRWRWEKGSYDMVLQLLTIRHTSPKLVVTDKEATILSTLPSIKVDWEADGLVLVYCIH